MDEDPLSPNEEKPFVPDAHPRYSASIQGAEFKLRFHHNGPSTMPEEPRGNVWTFSRQARLRMLSWVARTDWTSVPNAKLLTLTYPDQRADRTYQERTKDRERMHRYIEDHLHRPIPYLWRSEFEERQSGRYKGMLVPHFHLLMFGARFVPKELIRAWWKTIITWREHCVTHIKQAKDGAHAAFYVAKYQAKLQVQPTLEYCAYLHPPGRMWGVVRKALIQRAPLIHWPELTPEQVEAIYDVGEGKLPWLSRCVPQAFRLMGKHAKEAAARIRETTIDGYGEIV